MTLASFSPIGQSESWPLTLNPRSVSTYWRAKSNCFGYWSRDSDAKLLGSARTRAAKLGVVTSATDIKRCAEYSRDPFLPDDILAGESWGLARVQGSPVLGRSSED
jgi:hypothetical protein